VLLAEQIGTLASLARGPFVMQCAIGGGHDQFRAFDVPLRERPSRFEHTLRIVRTLCAGEEVDGIRIAPVPPEPLEVWIGASAPKAIDRAARLGDVFLIGPEATPFEVPTLVETYREACALNGRPPARVAIRRDVHVGADAADAERVAGPVLARGYRGFDPSATVTGSVDDVAAAFNALGDAGCSDVIIRHLADDQGEVLRSFARLADVRAAVA
jgi:alkanesulfonate monooxygenase SsuD/methylene tetrahydromethanopterin reductase-like flavin-dependent oxidoreductase (luciferase family)